MKFVKKVAFQRGRDYAAVREREVIRQIAKEVLLVLLAVRLLVLVLAERRA